MDRSATAARLLLVHAVLAVRWLIMFAIILWISKSLSVSLQMGGWFCGWVLLVLVADTSVATSISSGNIQASAAVAVVLNFLLITLLALGVPLVGQWFALLPSVLVLLAAAAVRSWRRLPTTLYGIWAASESLAGLGLGQLLYATFSVMLSDEHGHVDEGLLAMWNCILLVIVLGWLSLALQLALFVALLRVARNGGARSPRMEALCQERDLELVPYQCSTTSTVSLLHRHRKRTSWVCRTTVVGFSIGLLLGAMGYVWFLFESVGTVYTDLPAPVCDSCYCEARYTSTTVKRNIQYATRVDPTTGARTRLLLDVYRASPTSSVDTANSTGRSDPAVLLLHGGGFHGGDKRSTLLKDEAVELAKRGFVVFNVNYRLQAHRALPSIAAVRNAVDDAREAVRFITANAEHFGVDSHRVAIWGSSAGAITAVSLSFARDKPSVRSSNGYSGYSSNITAAVGISGSIWPFFIASQGHRTPQELPVPWLDVHGTADGLVPFFLAKMTHLYLRALGAQPDHNRLLVVPHGEHLPWHPRNGHCRSADPCFKLRPHVYAFLVRAMELGGKQCTI